MIRLNCSHHLACFFLSFFWIYMVFSSVIGLLGMLLNYISFSFFILPFFLSIILMYFQRDIMCGSNKVLSSKLSDNGKFVNIPGKAET